MRTIPRSRFVAGKVLVGPKVIGRDYYRIVALEDRSGRIERYDPRTRQWSEAPDSVTFAEVWRAPLVSQFLMDRGCAGSAARHAVTTDE